MAIVCHCEAVRDRTILRAIRRGCTDLDSIRDHCGAAARCGGCAPAVCDLIDRYQTTPTSNSASTPTPPIALA
jgi:bacterioferritin-associated ferredoxin